MRLIAEKCGRRVLMSVHYQEEIDNTVVENRRINLLQVVHGFGRGGGETKLLELIRRLDKDKYNISICSVGKSGRMEEEFRGLGLDVYIFKSAWKYDLSLPGKVARIIRERGIDIVQTTLFFADIIGAMAASISQPTALVSWEVITHPLNRKRQYMYKLLRNRFDMVVTVSDSIHKFVIERRGQHPGRIKTIYYGVDLNTYSSEVKKGSLAAQLGAPTDKIFGVVAHFRTQKGHTYLVEAVPKVLRKYPHAKFVFVGTGREEENVKREVQGRGLSGNIIFLGLRYDIKELLNEFDVFILPSLWEGFPNVVLEAMACAKPVIGTAVEGTIELVRDGETGFLVPPRNPDALADAIVKILDHEELIDIFGRAGRKRVEENFTVERQVAEFEELYDALASRTLCIERSNSEGALKLGERVISNL